MSELKATTVYDAYWTANSTGQGTGVQVYFKSEADKVIAELQSKITLASLAEDCSHLRHKRCNYCSELQRQKYKRCLAMAERCYNASVTMYTKRDTEPIRECKYWYHYRGIWWEKWKRKWLQLAEKFKETSNGTH